MKKLLKVLALALALCLLCGMALADDDGDSTPDGTPWDDATREHAAYLGDYTTKVEPTCTEPGVGRYECSFGDGHFHELPIKPLGHNYDENAWEITKEPTCTEKGERVNKCTRCGEPKTEEIDPNGHLWSSEVDGINWGRVIKEPTCSEEGLAEDYCIVCGEVNDFVQPRVIDKLAHVYEMVIDTLPTCRENGKAHDACINCGAYRIGDDTDANGMYDVTVADMQALMPEFEGHNWDNWVTEKQATCYADGIQVRWCKICGDKQEKPIPVLDPVMVKVEPSRLVNCYQEEVIIRCALCHGEPDADGYIAHPDEVYLVDVVAHTFKREEAYEVEKVEPTCTDEGYITYKCVFEDDCAHTVGDKYEYDKVTIPALGHDWDKWIVRYQPGEHGNEYGYWLRECKREGCGIVEERISEYAPECEGEHTWVKVETDVEPTCTTNGADIMKCSKCGKLETIETPAIGHDEVEEVFEPTCEEAGYTRFVCNNCGNMRIEAGEDALGHDYGEGKVVIPATCELEGKTLYTCSICGDNYVEVVPATGHDEEEIPAVDPTCVETGLTAGVQCTVCHEILVEQEEIPATGVHNYEKVAGTAPTCTEDGLTDGMKCTMCGDEMIAQTVLPALGHEIVVDAAVEATCTEAGLTEGSHCTRCEDATVAQEEIPALGHAWDEGVITTEPTEENGGVKTYTCTVCGATQEEKLDHEHDNNEEVVIAPTCTVEGKKLLTCKTCGFLQTEILPATGHTEEEIPAVDPTCTETGLTAGKKCSVCGTVTVEQEEVAMIDHVEEEIPAVDPTCTETGLTAGKKCSVCGTVTVEQEEVAAIGHTYVKDAAVAPTCTEAGKKEGSHCSACGDVMIAQEEVPALGHTEETVAGKAATCTETGLTDGKVCSVCGVVTVEQEEIPALGHAWDKGIITTEATPDADGVKTYTCTACGETKEEAVPYVFGEVPAYTLTNMSYANNKITGTAVHDPSTVESKKLYARVTVFFVGGTYAVFADYVEDGVIDIEVHGTVLGVSVNLTGTKNVVPGAEMTVFDSWGEYYR